MLGKIGTVWSKMKEGLKSMTRNEDDVEGEGEKDDEVVGTNGTNEIAADCYCGKEVGSDGSCDAILVPQVSVVEEIIACEASEVGKSDCFGIPFGGINPNGEGVDGVNAKYCSGGNVDGVGVGACNEEQVGSVHADNCTGGQVCGGVDDKGNVVQADNVQSKSRRGRKRKNMQVPNNAQRVKMIDLNEPPVVHLSGRVLRSRTVADSLVKEDVKDVDEETDEGADKKKLKMKNLKEKSGERSIRRVLRSRIVVDDLVIRDLNEKTHVAVVKKKSKLENVEVKSAKPSIRRVLRSNTVADDKIIGDLNEEPDEGVDEVDKKKSKLEKVEDRSAESSRRVLRSSSVADDKVIGDLNEDPEVGVDKKKSKLEKVEDKSAEPSRRVLRSSTVADDIVIGDLNEEPDEGVDGVDKKKSKLEKVEDKSAERSRRVLRSRTVADDSVTGDLISVHEETDEGVHKKKSKLECVEEKSANPSIVRVLRSRTVTDDLVKWDLNDVDEETEDEVDKKKLKQGDVEEKTAESSIGRVLRSRTMADDLVIGDMNDVNEETDAGVDNKESKLESIEEKSAEPSIKRVLRSRTVADDLVIGDLNGVNEETDEGVDEVDKKKPKLENAEEHSIFRVLRSRTVTDEVKGNLNDVDEETDGVVKVDKNELKLEDVEDKSVQPSIGRVLRSRTVSVCADNLFNGHLNDVDQETDEGVIKKKSKLEHVEDKSAEPSRRGKLKKIKGRRGRPPKLNGENGYNVVVAGNKDKVLGSKVSLKSGTSISKLKGDSGVNEKKDIRNQILDMITRCGWKIQLIPRASRDYNDPVYVNPEGKTHWSITKAYKDLKERIDSGKANTLEQAGFTVIPEDTLSKLFRVITKKRSDCGIKRSEVVEEKGLVKNGASSKKTDESQSRGRKRKSVPLEGRQKRRFALLARGSENRSEQHDDESELYNKKRSLLSWMIDLKTINEGADVQYRDPINGTTLLEGKVTNAGLSCNCCNEVHTILGFQLHAGNKSGEPLKNLYLGSELSLFQCMANSWTQQVELSKIGFCSVDVAVGDYNDDTCNMCGDGGNLMCCDFCPSTFHLSCLDIEDVPDGDWHCMYCTCKFCGSVDDEALSQDDGHPLVTCQLCEAKFHSTCSDQTDAKSVNSATTSFCGVGCQKIFDRLQKLVGLKHEIEGGLSWTILSRCDAGNDASSCDYPQKMECNAKLAVAYAVMDECFLPVVDPRSQSDMIINVIYNCGSNFRRLNYSGFYTFILEKGDEVVSVASIRFHGTQLAEMPFIATRNIYRRQGLSRQLLSVIEKILSAMDIQKLVIPAVSDVMAMWTGSFGFIPLEDATWQEMKTMSIIAFPGTDMLQKSLLETTGSESETSAPQVEPNAGADLGDEIVNSIVDGQAVETTGSESETSAPQVKPIEGANPGDEIVNAIVDGQAVDDSEKKGDEEA